MRYTDETLESFVLGQLNAQESQEIKNQMLLDEDLKKRIQDLNRVNQVGQLLLEKDLYGVLKSAENKEKKTKIFSIRKLAVAASIVGLLLSFWGIKKYIDHQNYLSRVEMVMSDYTPPQVVFTRSGENNTIAEIDKAKDAFSKKDYGKCLEILNQMDTKLRDDEYHWLKGHTLFVRQDFEGAIGEFESVKLDFDKKEDVDKMKQSICQILISLEGCH